MAKQKKSNEELITLIDKYFFEVNHEQIKCLKYTDIAAYLSKITGSVIMEYDIRRNKEIASYIKKLKSDSKKLNESNALVYIPLDVTMFIHKNNNPYLLKKSLLERDQYYQSIYSTACEISSENNLIEKKLSELLEANKALKLEIKEQNDHINMIYNENKNLKIQLIRLRDIVKDSVYPEIANELLREISFLEDGEKIINTSSYKVINDTDSLISLIQKNEAKYSDNNVIQGLFDKL